MKEITSIVSVANRFLVEIGALYRVRSVVGEMIGHGLQSELGPRIDKLFDKLLGR